MADEKISETPAVTVAGGELVPVVKAGVTSHTTTGAIAALGGGGGGGADPTAVHSPDGSVQNLVIMSKTDYDAIAPGDEGTVYLTYPEA